MTENAFFGNKMKYEEFDAMYSEFKGYLSAGKMQEEKLDKNDGLAKYDDLSYSVGSYWSKNPVKNNHSSPDEI